MDNEPQYGFLSTDREALAKALEAVRRTICGYNMSVMLDDFRHDPRCDCKYGLDVDKLVSGEVKYGSTGEQTGCPELRSVIHMLLHPED